MTDTEAQMTSNQHTTAPVPDCMVCEQLFSRDRNTVLEAEQFVGYVSTVYPWCVMLSARRHDCEGPWDMNEAESTELGRLIPQLSRAIKDTGTEMVYVLNFGEGVPVPHYHVAFFSRYELMSEVLHEALYNRVTAEAPEPSVVATRFASDVRAQLSAAGTREGAG
jgi:diadenosine tetraphosphate (Ap4A) HIT family hydrolase